MRIGEVREILHEMLAARPRDRALKNAVNTFSTRIAGHENMAINDFLGLFRRSSPTPPEPAPKPPGKAADQLAAEIAVTLRRAFNDDLAFEAEIKRIDATRAVTKPILVKVFERLFERIDGVPKSARRDELIQLIADERNTLVSNENMGELLGRRTVPA